MSRSKLASPTARAKHCEIRRKPYWEHIDRKTYLGYRKNNAGGTWIARVYHLGRYPERVIGNADDHQTADGREWLDHGQAKRRALDMAEELRAPKGHTARQKVETMADLAKQYLEWQDANKRGSKGTRGIWETHIAPVFGERSPASITGPELAAFRDHLAKTPPRVRTIDASDPEAMAKAIKKRGRKAVEAALKRAKEAAKHKMTHEEMRARRASVNRVLAVIKAMLNWGADAERELIKCDPYWKNVKPFKGVNEARIRFVSADEAQRLANACPPDFRALVQAALYIGARYGELTKAKVEDFKPQVRQLELRAENTKSGKLHRAQLSPKALALLEQITAGRAGDEPLFVRADGTPWGKNHDKRPMAVACEVAKIKPAISFHILRHTFAADLASKGVAIQAIGKLMGHSDFRVTDKHYAHLGDDTLLKVLDNFQSDLGGFVPSKKVAKLHPRAA